MCPIFFQKSIGEQINWDQKLAMLYCQERPKLQGKNELSVTAWMTNGHAFIPEGDKFVE